MTLVVDTSVVVAVLRGDPAAAEALSGARAAGPLHASEVVMLEVLAGMREHEERATRALLDVFAWHPVDERIAEIAGGLGRRWLASHRGIDSADLAIAATVIALDGRLLTKNVKHFPMFGDLAAPY